MAGSYAHVVNDQGQLISNNDFPHLIENLGDAYEAIEEMYGMIWFLARGLAEEPMTSMVVDQAERNWKRGIQLSPGKEGDPDV